jgi:predicted nucleotidyltransferase
MTSDLEDWSSVLTLWARAKPQIAEVWLYGSRIRGSFRDDSDLDVAIVMSGKSKEARYGNWVALADSWEKELKALLPVAVDLDIGDEDIAQEVVAPALRREGRRIFQRSEKA